MTAVLSLGDEIATYLQGHSLSTSLNFNGAGTVNLFVSQMPDQPDVAVAIIERGGRAPIMTLTGTSAAESRIDQPQVQIRVRTGMTGYTVGQALAQSVYKALQGVNETTLTTNGQLFHLITAVQSPVYLGRDEKERHMWSQNFSIQWDNAAR